MTNDQRLDHVLRRATAVFVEKRYKDQSYTRMLEGDLAALEGTTDPRDKLSLLIRAYLEFGYDRR